MFLVFIIVIGLNVVNVGVQWSSPFDFALTFESLVVGFCSISHCLFVYVSLSRFVTIHFAFFYFSFPHQSDLYPRTAYAIRGVVNFVRLIF